MKKFTAILVMTAMLCTFVSCGKDTADDVENESSVTSSAEVSEDSTEETTEEITEEITEESTEEITQEITEPETTEVLKTSVEGTEEYAEVIEKYLECQNKDSDTIIDLCFPDKYCDTIRVLYNADLFSLYGVIGFINSIDCGLVSIDSVEPVSEEYIPYFNAYYGSFQPVYEYIEKNGTENPDIDKLSEIMSTPITEPIEIYFNIEKAVIVDTTISREFNDGTEDPEYEKIVDQEYALYYIDGEGWKIDVLTMGKLYEAEDTMVLDELRSLYSASETVLTELEEKGVALPENCIICSDSSKNYNVSDEFLSMFDNTLDGCYEKKDGFDYFVMINDGKLACVSGKYATKPRFYRTFPTEYRFNEDDYVIESYDERYNLCLDRMKNGQPQSYMKH